MPPRRLPGLSCRAPSRRQSARVLRTSARTSRLRAGRRTAIAQAESAENRTVPSRRCFSAPPCKDGAGIQQAARPSPSSSPPTSRTAPHAGRVERATFAASSRRTDYQPPAARCRRSKVGAPLIRRGTRAGCRRRRQALAPPWRAKWQNLLCCPWVAVVGRMPTAAVAALPLCVAVAGCAVVATAAAVEVVDVSAAVVVVGAAAVAVVGREERRLLSR